MAESGGANNIAFGNTLDYSTRNFTNKDTIASAYSGYTAQLPKIYYESRLVVGYYASPEQMDSIRKAFPERLVTHEENGSECDHVVVRFISDVLIEGVLKMDFSDQDVKLVGPKLNKAECKIKAKSKHFCFNNPFETDYYRSLESKEANKKTVRKLKCEEVAINHVIDSLKKSISSNPTSGYAQNCAKVLNEQYVKIEEIHEELETLCSTTGSLESSESVVSLRSCNVGAENCNVRCDTVLSFDSLYDIDILRFFENCNRNGATYVYATCIIPFGLRYVENYASDELRVRFKRVGRGFYMCHMDDLSTGYVHDNASIIMRLMESNFITTSTGNWYGEILKSRAEVCLIKFTPAHKMKVAIRKMVPPKFDCYSVILNPFDYFGPFRRSVPMLVKTDKLSAATRYFARSKNNKTIIQDMDAFVTTTFANVAIGSTTLQAGGVYNNEMICAIVMYGILNGNFEISRYSKTMKTALNSSILKQLWDSCYAVVLELINKVSPTLAAYMTQDAVERYVRTTIDLSEEVLLSYNSTSFFEYAKLYSKTKIEDFFVKLSGFHTIVDGFKAGVDPLALISGYATLIMKENPDVQLLDLIHEPKFRRDVECIILRRNGRYDEIPEIDHRLRKYREVLTSNISEINDFDDALKLMGLDWNSADDFLDYYYENTDKDIFVYKPDCIEGSDDMNMSVAEEYKHISDINIIKTNQELRNVIINNERFHNLKIGGKPIRKVVDVKQYGACIVILRNDISGEYEVKTCRYTDSRLQASLYNFDCELANSVIVENEIGKSIKITEQDVRDTLKVLSSIAPLLRSAEDVRLIKKLKCHLRRGTKYFFRLGDGNSNNIVCGDSKSGLIIDLRRELTRLGTLALKRPIVDGSLTVDEKRNRLTEVLKKRIGNKVSMTLENSVAELNSVAEMVRKLTETKIDMFLDIIDRSDFDSLLERFLQERKPAKVDTDILSDESTVIESESDHSENVLGANELKHEPDRNLLDRENKLSALSKAAQTFNAQRIRDIRAGRGKISKSKLKKLIELYTKKGTKFTIDLGGDSTLEDLKAYRDIYASELSTKNLGNLKDLKAQMFTMLDDLIKSGKCSLKSIKKKIFIKNGVAGCGKTKYIVDNFVVGDAYIVPFTNICLKTAEEVKAHLKLEKVQVKTYEKIGAIEKSGRKLYFDEGSAFSLPYFFFVMLTTDYEEYIILGDDEQTEAFDCTGTLVRGVFTDLVKYYCDEQDINDGKGKKAAKTRDELDDLVERVYYSFRYGPTTALFMNTVLNYPVFSLRETDTALEIHDISEIKGPLPGNSIVISDKQKEYYDSFMNTSTSKSSQGLSHGISNVILRDSDAVDFMNFRQQSIVACSRAQEQLNIFIDTASSKGTMPFIREMIANFHEVLNIEIANVSDF